MISAGHLTERINIEQRPTTQDAIGQPVETWSLVAAVWASIRHPSGLSAIKADADVSIVKASIRIRFRAGIDAGMRVVHSATIYDIKAVLPNRAGGYVDLVCEVIK
ncbi:MAG: phage head closure protein [Azonexus sp.]